MGMQNLKTILLVSILVLLAACSEKAPKYDERLTDVYEMLGDYNNTDSAFNILKGINVNHFSAEHNRAYYAYLYTVCLYWLNAHAEDDELIKIAVDYYSEKGDSAMRAKVFTYAALVYQSIDEKEIAVECYNKALEAIPEDSANLKAQIYSNWAVMINMDKIDEESMELYEKVKDYAWRADNIYLVADACVHQGWNHLFHNRIDDAIKCYKEALSLLEHKEWGDALKFASLNKLAHCYALKNENEIALTYAKEAEKYVRSITNRRYLNHTLCEIYINQNQWDKAGYCLALADDTMAYKGKVGYFERLVQIEQGKGNYQKASNLIDRYVHCIDSMYLEIIEDNAAMYQKKYDKTKVMLENAVLEVDNKHLETMLLLLVIVVSVFTMFAVMIAYRRRMIVANREKAKDEAMSGLTDQLQGKIIELQEVRLQLAERENDVNDSRQEMLVLREQILDMNAVVQKIKELKKTKTADLYGKKSALGEDELTVLMEALDTCYNGALSRLKEAVPNISKDELNMCCLVCLNVPLSKAALLLGTSEETLRQRKYRFRHTKLSLPEGTTVDEFVRSFLQ